MTDYNKKEINVSTLDSLNSSVSNFYKALEQCILDNDTGSSNPTDNNATILQQLSKMDPQTAFVYMLAVVIPALQDKQTIKMEEFAKDEKIEADLLDEWNKVRSLINDMQQNIAKMPKFGEHLTKDQEDALVKFQKDMKDLKSTMQDLQDKIKDARATLPDSAKSLLDSLQNSLTNLQDLPKQPSEVWSNDYWISTKDHRWGWDPTNPEDGTMSDYVGFEKMITNSDQTEFTAYTSNISTGLTALTSTSNITQNMLQMATQQYNSISALLKAGYDCINKVETPAISNIKI